MTFGETGIPEHERRVEPAPEPTARLEFDVVSFFDSTASYEAWYERMYRDDGGEA